jgi:hypothetical protein
MGTSGLISVHSEGMEGSLTPKRLKGAANEHGRAYRKFPPYDDSPLRRACPKRGNVKAAW